MATWSALVIAAAMSSLMLRTHLVAVAEDCEWLQGPRRRNCVREELDCGKATGFRLRLALGIMLKREMGCFAPI
jgi:hypothetical protein